MVRRIRAGYRGDILVNKSIQEHLNQAHAAWQAAESPLEKNRAESALFDAVGSLASNLLRRKGWPWPSEVPDVVHLTQTKVLLKIRSFRGESTFATWVRTIAEREIVDKARYMNKLNGSEVAGAEDQDALDQLAYEGGHYGQDAGSEVEQQEALAVELAQDELRQHLEDREFEAHLALAVQGCDQMADRPIEQAITMAAIDYCRKSRNPKAGEEDRWSYIRKTVKITGSQAQKAVELIRLRFTALSESASDPGYIAAYKRIFARGRPHGWRKHRTGGSAQ